MKHAYVFPGQGAQAVGMGKDLYEHVPEAKALFEQANEILGFRITDIMFAGTDEELKQTKVTQPAVFLHSVIMAKALGVKPDAVAGHSLGEFSALVVAGALSFEDGLKLVSKRAMAMQAACEAQPGTMAAILGLEDKVVEDICSSIDGVVVAANYNCPGQLVISGAVEAVEAACEKAKEAGARRALRLPVGGAFHSPLMEPAKQELQKAIEEAPFQTPSCPIYQNVDAKPYTDPARIKANLIAQLTAPVRWTYIVKNMLADGVTEFTELGPGTVLQGLIKKVDKEAVVESKSPQPDLALYRGPSDEAFDKDGKRIERSIYSRPWIKNVSGEIPVTITLKGLWKVTETPYCQVVVADRKQTVLRFTCRDAVSLDVELKR